MKHRSVFSRLLSLMLALLTAVSCLVAIPLTASAVEDLNAVSSFEPLDGPSWQIDLTKLPESSGPPNAVTVGDYSIYKGSKNLVFHTVTLDGEEETVLGVQNTCAALVISDVKMGLSSYEQFTFSTQLYFDEFPTGTRETSTADELPLSPEVAGEKIGKHLPLRPHHASRQHPRRALHGEQQYLGHGRVSAP